MNHPMYEKKNWIDFESEISRVIQSIDKDIRKYKADDDTVVRGISVSYFAEYFLDDYYARVQIRDGSPRAEFYTDEDRRAMRIRIPIHPAFLEEDDQVSLSDSYEKATKKLSKKKIEQYDKILKLLNDGEWHKTAEIADNLGLKDTRTKELLKELIALDKLIDNGKTKGKLYRLK